MAITRMTLPTIKELADTACNDVKRLKIRTGIAAPNVAPGSETAIKAEAFSSLAFNIYAQVSATQDATMPDSAQGDDLKRYAKVHRDMDPSPGAGATGFVAVSCTGVVTYPVWLECKSPDGLRYQVLTTTIATDGTLVPVIGIDTGKRTDKAANTTMTWTSPPAGSDTTCVVGPSGLNNGIDPDNTERLRKRLLDAIRHPGASGSWAHYAEWAEENAAVEKAFVYPAARGPSTVNVAYTVEADKDNLTGAYTREGSVALTNAVALNVVGNDPEHVDVLTTAVADQDTSVALRAILPLPVEDGGPGGGWKDGGTTHWPNAVLTPTASPTHLEVAPTVDTVIQVDCRNGTTNAPAAEAQIAIWSGSAKKFVHAKVKTVTLVAGTVYDLELYSSVDTSLLDAGDYVSPDADNIDDYGDTIAAQFAALGPGEVTSDANLIPRALRHPLKTESWSSSLTSAHIGAMSTNHPEVSHVTCDLPTLPASPTVAATTSSPPNVLVLGKLAIYKQT